MSKETCTRFLACGTVACCCFVERIEPKDMPVGEKAVNTPSARSQLTILLGHPSQPQESVWITPEAVSTSEWASQRTLGGWCGCLGSGQDGSKWGNQSEKGEGERKKQILNGWTTQIRTYVDRRRSTTCRLQWGFSLVTKSRTGTGDQRVIGR